MLILKYFVVVGAVLAAGLFALSAHMAPSGAAAPAMIHGSTTASLAVVPPSAPAVKEEEPVQAVTPPAAPAKGGASSRRASRSEHGQRRHGATAAR